MHVHLLGWLLGIDAVMACRPDRQACNRDADCCSRMCDASNGICTGDTCGFVSATALPCCFPQCTPRVCPRACSSDASCCPWQRCINVTCLSGEPARLRQFVGLLLDSGEILFVWQNDTWGDCDPANATWKLEDTLSRQWFFRPKTTMATLWPPSFSPVYFLSAECDASPLSSEPLWWRQAMPTPVVARDESGVWILVLTFAGSMGGLFLCVYRSNLPWPKPRADGSLDTSCVHPCASQPKAPVSLSNMVPDGL
jgi:hypothetical protein